MDLVIYVILLAIVVVVVFFIIDQIPLPGNIGWLVKLLIGVVVLILILKRVLPAISGGHLIH